MATWNPPGNTSQGSSKYQLMINPSPFHALRSQVFEEEAERLDVDLAIGGDTEAGKREYLNSRSEGRDDDGSVAGDVGTVVFGIIGAVVFGGAASVIVRVSFIAGKKFR